VAVVDQTATLALGRVNPDHPARMKPSHPHASKIPVAMRHRDNDSEDGPMSEIGPGELSRVFVAPPWLRDAGIVAWLIVGIVLVLVGLVWLLGLTSSIIVPLVTATMVAAVLTPVVGWLQARGLPRWAATAVVLLAVVAVGAALGVMVLAGVTSQIGDIRAHLQGATDKLSQWLGDLGVSDSSSQAAEADARSSVSAMAHLLLNGLANGISQIASLAAFASFTILSLLFLLKDGPVLRSWVERHSGLPPAVARTVSTELQRALRGYFGGVTIIAAFTAVLVGATALIIGTPLAGTIAVVTFLGGYVPYIGAWAAGAFAVLIALGSQGTEAALVMAVVALLANGALQQLIQPLAFGAVLDLHPLAVLVVTIAAGSLFGMIGLVLAAPITSAIVHISHALAHARAPAIAGGTAAEVPA
jgi:predicted PurR-regulated permease PerM